MMLPIKETCGNLLPQGITTLYEHINSKLIIWMILKLHEEATATAWKISASTSCSASSRDTLSFNQMQSPVTKNLN